MTKPKFKIADVVKNISGATGVVVCVAEGLKGWWYSVRYDVEPDRVFLNAEKSLTISSDSTK